MKRTTSHCARIIVVGAGAAGLAAALALSRRGAQVCVLDAGRPGRGALWASGGMLAAGFESAAEAGARGPMAQRFAALSAAAAEAWPDWAARIERLSGRSIGYQRLGAVTPAFDRSELARLERTHAAALCLRVGVERIGGRVLSDLEPALAPSLEALVFPGDGQLDNRRLGPALVSAVEALGGEVRGGARVRALDLKAGCAAGVVLESGESIAAEGVVLATGAAGRIEGAEAAAPPMRPVKGQMLSLDGAAGGAPQRIVRSFSIYLATKPDGRVVAGATSEPGRTGEAPETATIARLRRAAGRAAPALKHARETERWAGVRPMARDRMPVVGASPIAGLTLALGAYRNGVLLAPMLGEAAAAAALGARAPAAAAPFRPDRPGLRG